MRILLVDDHELVRSGLRLLLTQIDPRHEIIEAEDGRRAVTLARMHAPQICLMDLTMPGMNGLDAIPRVLRHSPSTRVIALSMHTGHAHVGEAFRVGAHGYLVKDAAVSELKESIEVVAAGRRFLSKQVADTLLVDFVKHPGGMPESPRPDAGMTLTPRQREVLQLVAEGASTREMADRLCLSIKTIESHRAELMRRLDIHDVAGLTRYAIRLGIVQLES